LKKRQQKAWLYLGWSCHLHRVASNVEQHQTSESFGLFSFRKIRFFLFSRKKTIKKTLVLVASQRSEYRLATPEELKLLCVWVDRRARSIKPFRGFFFRKRRVLRGSLKPREAG
jgi:hypothetical protein